MSYEGRKLYMCSYGHVKIVNCSLSADDCNLSADNYNCEAPLCDSTYKFAGRIDDTNVVGLASFHLELFEESVEYNKCECCGRSDLTANRYRLIVPGYAGILSEDMLELTELAEYSYY